MTDLLKKKLYIFSVHIIQCMQLNVPMFDGNGFSIFMYIYLTSSKKYAWHQNQLFLMKLFFIEWCARVKANFKKIHLELLSMKKNALKISNTYFRSLRKTFYYVKNKIVTPNLATLRSWIILIIHYDTLYNRNKKLKMSDV